jgi:pimeloyl-ACP methyl ester carboxylesterase
VLLHGLGATRRIWGLVTEPLAAARRVITLDLPGFGKSPTERARLAEAGERRAAGTSFLNATTYGVGGMIEDYPTGATTSFDAAWRKS